MDDILEEDDVTAEFKLGLFDFTDCVDCCCCCCCCCFARRETNCWSFTAAAAASRVMVDIFVEGCDVDVDWTGLTRDATGLAV